MLPVTIPIEDIGPRRSSGDGSEVKSGEEMETYEGIAALTQFSISGTLTSDIFACGSFWTQQRPLSFHSEQSERGRHSLVSPNENENSRRTDLFSDSTQAGVSTTCVEGLLTRHALTDRSQRDRELRPVLSPKRVCLYAFLMATC